MTLQSLDSSNHAHLAKVVSIWNDACGVDLALNARCVEYNTRPTTGAVRAGQLALRQGEPIGFILASALPNDPRTSSPETGWIDAVAVASKFQRQGFGRELLEWAAAWLRQHGCTRARLGGGLRPFAPGLPVECESIAYFKTRGYVERAGSAAVWDVARDLRAQDPAQVLQYEGARPATSYPTRPAESGDENALLEFFHREFPNRWCFEFEDFLRARGRISDYQVLLADHKIHGFARLTYGDSERPIERFFMHRLPRPWGQLGPIGVSRELRGQGLGKALLAASLQRLRDGGISGCLIDWTDLVEFYEKFGFAPFRGYSMLVKDLITK